MWQSKYEKTFTNISKETIWSAWTDVNNWATWDLETDSAELNTPFAVGNFISLKPKGAPKVKVQLTEIIPFTSFTDMTKFPFAKMHDVHTLTETADGVTVTSIVKIEGPLSWLWKKIVAENVARGSAQQIDSLTYARKKQDEHQAKN